jgi:hypothetical protein
MFFAPCHIILSSSSKGVSDGWPCSIMGKKGTEYRVLVEKPEEKKPL